MSKKQIITGNIAPPNKDLETLKKHFSQCFDKNGNLDFEKFKKQLLKNEINFSKESYGMDWLGKSYARLLATDETTTLLKEDETFNQKPENANSENLLIKGDNLEVLKHLSNAYYEKIKMIYIDPPYNTGSDGFVYADDRKFTKDELQELAGISEERAKRILDFTQSNSNSHSAWLTFMYPRLYIAKQLLKEDGVIFISIDDNEVAQLRLLMDEVFGEENFVGDLIWLKKRKGSFLSKQLVSLSENILVYFKNKENSNSYLFGGVADENESQPIVKRTNGISVLKIPKGIISTKLPDGKYEKGIYGKDVNPVELLDDIIFENGVNSNSFEIKAPFTWSQGFFDKEIKKGSKPVINTTNFQIRVFRINDDDSHKGLGNVISGVEIKGTNEDAYEELEKLMNVKKVFDYSKPSNLIKKLIISSTQFEKNALILDFFAGSGTTADAVMQLNAEDGGNRKFILAQLPEKIDPKKNKTAYDFVVELNKNRDTKKFHNVTDKITTMVAEQQFSYVKQPTIFEITKERILRASKKIQEETLKTKIAEKQKEIKDLESQLNIDGKEEKIKQLKTDIKALKNQDLGFKIFETMPIWEDYHFEADELDAQQMLLFDESKLTKEDIKALLVTWKTYDGVPLTQPLQEINLGESQINNSPLTINNYTAHYSNGKLYLMNKGFKTKNLKTLLEKIDSDKEFNPTTIIAFGYHFESKNLREISENIKSYTNKKSIDIDFITRY